MDKIRRNYPLDIFGRRNECSGFSLVDLRSVRRGAGGVVRNIGVRERESERERE